MNQLVFHLSHMVRQALVEGRTASGISMLMSAANGSIRNVVKNIDDYLLAPLGKAFFGFNMQFDFDKEIKGDLEIKAQAYRKSILMKCVVNALCSLCKWYQTLRLLHLHV